MVFILQELTKEITGVIAKIYDVDGEFLLIEAANYLPSWANPETSENTVIKTFIYFLVLIKLKKKIFTKFLHYATLTVCDTKLSHSFLCL